MTATVVIQNENGCNITVRALLDSASEGSFIKERCIKCLRLTREKRDVMIQALLGMQVPVVRGSTNIKVHPVGQNNLQFNVDVLILWFITGPVPSERLWSKFGPTLMD